MNVNLEQLVEHIYVAPTSGKWFATLVEDVAKKYGVHVRVRHSDLMRDPVY